MGEGGGMPGQARHDVVRGDVVRQDEIVTLNLIQGLFMKRDAGSLSVIAGLFFVIAGSDPQSRVGRDAGAGPA